MLKYFFMALMSLVGICGCRKMVASVRCPNADALHLAALYETHIPSVFLGDSQQTIDYVQGEVDKLEAWAKTQNFCVMQAYMGWVDYYNGRLAEARKELATGSRKREMKEHEERSRRELDAARELHIPAPPRQ